MWDFNRTSSPVVAAQASGLALKFIESARRFYSHINAILNILKDFARLLKIFAEFERCASQSQQAFCGDCVFYEWRAASLAKSDAKRNEFYPRKGHPIIKSKTSKD